MQKVKGRAAAVGILFLANCDQITPRPGVRDVQGIISDRLLQQVEWDESGAVSENIKQQIGTMLDGPLKADDAVQIALLNNQTLQATFEGLGVSQSGLVQAGLLPNPTLFASARWADRATDREPVNERRAPHKMPLDVNTEFSITEDLLDIFLIPLRKKLAQTEYDQTKLRVAQDILDIAAQTREAFYMLQGSEQMLELRRTVVRATEASADAAKRLHDAGNIPEFDQASEQSEYEQAKLDLAQAEMGTIDARERLNVLMGLWGQQTQWTLAQRLPKLPGREIAVEGLESLAMKQRFDLQVAHRELEMTQQALYLTKTYRLSGIKLGVDTEKEGNRTSYTGPQLEIELPIFDWRQATIARQEAQVHQAERRYAALAVEIRSQVRAARSRMLANRSRAIYYQKIVLPLRHRITEQAQLQYNGMFIGVFQLLQTKQQEIDAGREYIEALLGYWTARTQLEKAVGGGIAVGESVSPSTMPVSAPSSAPSESDHQMDHSQHDHGDHP